ncbi:DUF294 nucleotidyltransferase-like domain-containing protein [Flavobacterium sp. ASW18X]|uniref:DUF294 nucleotidyltransferase-like domain-containing protein n=1 Tax=Flavobacterium sp. ASW18X TaxID=2572595 RepID=UPI0010AE57AC|nr:DUF294 nucleotidyltransferase-like domain-containing protein [Flavobacterium sp. ASW18X]TKD66262.1 CBS domain-containing protein [Flavobacterium sp. ASW18X]
MQNTISFRVADFLKRFPPFSYLNKSQLEELATEVFIIYKEKDEILFHFDEAPHEYFYTVHKGAVALWNTTDAVIVDICDEGDIFGLRPLMAQENYRLQAKTEEESIIYAIPIKQFKPFTRENEQLANFLVESFASNTRNPYSATHKGQLIGETIHFNPTNNKAGLNDVQHIYYSKNIISCGPGTKLKTVAKKMTKNKVGAMIVVKNKLPIGLITDKDFRFKIATGTFDILDRAANIMSTPIITYPKQLTVTQAQMAMMKNDISHLVLTEDGTPNTPAIGMLSKYDVMLSQGQNPTTLIRAIKRAESAAEIKPLRNYVMNLLRGYLKQNIPMALTAKIIAELNDACIKQVVKLALEAQQVEPPVPFAWLAMGSQGRSEQLLHTDQDNALVFQNVPKEQFIATQRYFLGLAKEITKAMHTIGYAYCPADMMASNPKWCTSLNEFKKLSTQWITNPGPNEMLLSIIFFDYNKVYGDEAIVQELSEHILKTIENYPVFLTHLAGSAMANPSPRGFFRNFLVEQDGEHKNQFDIKKRALMPLIDAARVLILSHNITGISNTWERYEKLAELEPNNKELYLACSYAFKALLKFRTKQGLQNNDSGRYIHLEALSKEEKVKLKRTFKTIKEIQELLNVRFMVNTIR